MNPTFISRLQKVKEEISTIASLQRITVMSRKDWKPCPCHHHKSSSRFGFTEGSHPKKEEIRHYCSLESYQIRPKLCLCNSKISKEQRSIETSKELVADKELKSQSKNSGHVNPEREMIDKDEATIISNSVGRESNNKFLENCSVTRNSVHFQPGNGDNDKSREVYEPKRVAVESQTPNSEIFDIDKLMEDKKNVEQMYKDLSNEKKRTLELEEKLEKMTCSFKCLKDENDQQTACLKDSLEKAKNQAKLATRSRNLAMDLVKQSRDQTDLVKASKEEILKRINDVNCDNSKLKCECEELRCKLKVISENEEKKCAEVDDEVNRIKCAYKQKEVVLANEKSELEKTVTEMTNLNKIQKKRINDLTAICKKQQSVLRDNENCISAKIAQLFESENRNQSISCKCKKMQEEINELKCRLIEEAESRKRLENESDDPRDNCNCELQIKDKIIADQIETIKKLKKLLQDSEKMAHQAAREFATLRDELHCLKQSNKSLRIALEETEAQIGEECNSECCERYNILKDELTKTREQKQKALMAGKFAAEKLCETTTEYRRKLDYDKRQHQFMTSLLHKKDTEIELLKKEILHIKEFRYRRSNDYIAE